MLGRLTQETNPETATTTYVYDSDTTCTGGYPAGNLVKKLDAVGNVTCYTYDQLHRLLSITYPSGSYSTNTDAKYFVYDSATVGGATMQNAKGRRAEAYTCPPTGSCATKKTDLGFSYSARSEVATVYEKTPNSGSTYYQVSASYWAHGGIDSLSSNLSGLPTIYYGSTDGTGLDGEGRVTKVNASSGQSPLVSAVTYTTSGVTQPIGSLTQVTFGSSDYDTFSYDPNTGRLNQYKFTVGATPQTVTGTLTWNSNGSLGSVAITDQLNSANTQTCNYSHDDLGRIASADCGAPWSQTFSFDPFGNINKNATSGISFLPTYSQSTNRYSSIPSCTPSYDANGFATNDCAHSYTWDAAGNPRTVDSVGLTYDALGRMVEQASGSVYTQIVYAPSGGKLALMNVQTLKKAFVRLPSGGAAVYTSTGLTYYRHSDWLGSGRLATTPTRTLAFDVAYGPYGESYAESGSVNVNFTGQNQDTVSGLYDFLFREYNANHGRWPSPDPAGRGAVSMENPQTWNRYAYAGNMPLNSVDDLGLLSWMSDAGPYIRAMARTAAFFSAFEFFTFTTLDKTWTPPDMVDTQVSASIVGDPTSEVPGATSLDLEGGGWSFQTTTTMVTVNVDGFTELQRVTVESVVRRSIERLKNNKKCLAAFHQAGPGELDATQYNGTFNPDIGRVADTQYGSRSVNINVNGPFFGGQQSYLAWARPDGVSLPDFQVITVLHELAHELGNMSPFVPDNDTDPAGIGRSMINTINVLNNCQQ
jgi:RHS repeat-associated protein